MTTERPGFPTKKPFCRRLTIMEKPQSALISIHATGGRPSLLRVPRALSNSDAKQAIEQAREKVLTYKMPPPPGLYEGIEKNGLELKKPGDSDWVNVLSPHTTAIRKINCPEGGSAQEIMP